MIDLYNQEKTDGSASHKSNPALILATPHPDDDDYSPSLMKSSFRLLDGMRDIALPTLTTANDVRELVQYLKKRPDGVIVSEVAQPIKKRIFYPPKVSAYEALGVAARHGERLHLTPFGWEFARSLEPEAHSYRLLLNNTRPYRAALEWIYKQDSRVITHDEVVKYWQEHHSNALNGNDTKSVEGNVVCFFHLCQAAELGTMTIGKRGQPARLRVLHDELCKLIEAVVQSAAPTDASTFNFKVNYSHTTADNGCMTHSLLPGKSPQLRVLISCGKDKRVVKQIQATLELEEAESEVVHREEAGACPVSENVIHAMRRCHAAIIVVNGYDCDENHSTDEVGEKIILQVGAALAFYDWRVMLLFDTGLSVPPCLENLPYGRYEGGDLTWDTGVNLMKVVKDFKSN